MIDSHSSILTSTLFIHQLTGRAFQITTGHQQLAPLEAAFDMPFIDWSRPLDPVELTERLYISYGVRFAPCTHLMIIMLDADDRPSIPQNPD